MGKQHVLKIHPAPLEALLSGDKTCEVRFNDRGFEVGDTVCLREIDPTSEQETGRRDHVRTITHIQSGYGLPDHVCVLSYAPLRKGYREAEQKVSEMVEIMRKARFEQENTGLSPADMAWVYGWALLSCGYRKVGE